MIQTLNRFSSESLFDATSHLLNKLNIEFDRETAEPINVADLYDGPMPQYLTDALECIKDTYFIGIVNDKSLAGAKSADSLDDVAETIKHGGKYDGMFVFACDAKQNANLTRTAASALTRAFNRLASANPVILIIRQNHLLSLSTCERMSYSQEWRQGSGEKLGKVSILRNINCVKPHRGHVDILESLGDKAYPTFEELYKHWMEIFSNELLTKKFYSELSDWYAWAVMVAKFPNDLNTEEDDAKYNHEACIRLITRLIFVWFLKQKHLIPEEFFDETYIRENLIDNFDPHDKQSLYYDAGESKYYRLILQNLFFAMLNCPIVAEGKTEPNNRRFIEESSGFHNEEHDINTLMRYRKEFKDGGADKFLRLANSNVPFLNGGLFDCLDKKKEKLYFDGFSEYERSLKQLYLPDWLFFGEEVGKGIDLSQWYDDKKKKNVSARGLIDILKRYSFTIEENTPLDQEVSLDPELLGKVFENLLAAYNPETQTSARKQTGSFYTPREIVQYMVNESLVAHLKRTCGDELEPEYRKLLSYSTEDTTLNEEQRKVIMHAVYNCRVLDPACGSGAFPMGVLQQMVHVLRQLDPTNEMWNTLMVDITIEETRKELEKIATNTKSDNKEERTRIEENKNTRLEDIENAFNQNVNDPDYARKLYLIEHCIYGVDIQPIAVQISKLRFFISLVVDQKPINDATHNFGIRPLPNLESKFVAANTLIPAEYDASLFESTDEILSKKAELKELNHQIFLAKRNVDKQRLKKEIKETRQALAKAIEDTGFVSQGAAELLANWDMFDQNASSSFFDPEWMFGVKDGFDIVIGNPPYKIVPRNDSCKAAYDSLYEVAHGGKRNLYHLFFERGISTLRSNGSLSYITPDTYFSGKDTMALRQYLIKNTNIDTIVHYTEKDKIFENVTQAVAVIVLRRQTHSDSFTILDAGKITRIVYSGLTNSNKFVFKSTNCVIESMKSYNMTFGIVCEGYKGDVNLALKRDYFCYNEAQDALPLVRGVQLSKYGYNPGDEYCFKAALSRDHTNRERIVFQEVANMGLEHRVKGTILRNIICGDSCNILFSKNPDFDNRFVLAVLNSKAVNYYFKFFNQTNHVPIGEIRNIPFPTVDKSVQVHIIGLVDQILLAKRENHLTDTTELEAEIDFLVYHLYGLTYDEVLIVDPETPITREEYESEM